MTETLRYLPQKPVWGITTTYKLVLATFELGLSLQSILLY